MQLLSVASASCTSAASLPLATHRLFLLASVPVGAILIIASKGPTDRALWEMFTAVQFIFGIGVGGEYPVASTSANERAESSRKLMKRRGETVILVFSMQGWGNLVNTAVIIGG